MGKLIKFGTDGWRGTIGGDFTFDNVRRVAQGLVNFIAKQSKSPLNKKQREKPKIIVGYDTRFLSKNFAAEFAKVLGASELAETIISSEELTTPMLSYATKKHKALLGAMITASHNPPEYNGIKFKSSDGASVPQETTAVIEKLIPPDSPLIKKINFENIRSQNLKKAYISKLQKTFGKFIADTRAKKSERRVIKIIFDPMHGSGAGGIFENLMSDFKQFKIIEINSLRDPLFGGINPEPIKKNLAHLTREVVRQKAAAGIAIDGDGDRIGVVDDRGRYLPPHTLFPVFLEHILVTKLGGVNWRGCAVQGVAMGYLSERIAARHGIKIKEVPVGFKHLAEELINNKKCLIGAEESGGIGFGSFIDYIPERDGLAAAMFLCGILSHSHLRLSVIADGIYKKYGLSFYDRCDLRLPYEKFAPDKKKIRATIEKFFLKDADATLSFIDGIKIRFRKDDSWLLVRPSGTEPLIRIYSESPDENQTNRLIEKSKNIILRSLSDS